jgi:hypothetical protein
MLSRPSCKCAFLLIGLAVAVAGCRASAGAQGAARLRATKSLPSPAITRRQINMDQSVLALSRYQVEMRDERRAIAKQAGKTTAVKP